MAGSRSGGFILALAFSLSLLVGPAQTGGYAYASPPTDKRANSVGSAQASIIGGKVASIASYPWLAHIRYQGPVEEFSCGGTVVSPRLILTAAHCVMTETGRVAAAGNFSVLSGLGNLDEETTERVSRVSRVLVFPEYDPARLVNDAALLVLATPTATPALPLATPSDAALLAGGTPLAVAGWGLVDFDPPRSPKVVHDAQSVVRGTSYCQRRLQRVLPVFAADSQFCVQSPPGPDSASLCNGDSGGPGIARRPDGTAVQIGVVSLKGSFDCNPQSPQVLTRVDRVSPWVAAWSAAVEFGAPEPIVAIPKVELPPMTRVDAEIVAWLGLERDFGNRFANGRYHQLACGRVNREKVKCRVQWLRGGNFYRGGITLYTALPREGSVYNYRYTVRRFDVDCWLEYLHPIQACNPRIFKR